VHTALTAKHPKARIALMSHRLATWTIPRLMPLRLLDRLMGKSLGLVKK
jgi:hypothetical protein